MAAETGEKPADGDGGGGSSPLGKGIGTTVLLSVAFYVVLYAILRVTGADDVTAEHVLVALMPFLILLINSNRIDEFRAGSLVVKLREQARSAITPGDDEVVEDAREFEALDLEPARVMMKMGVGSLDEQIREHPSTLSFSIGQRYYGPSIERYLDANVQRNPEFRYVLFVDGGGAFEGLMRASDFAPLARSDEHGVAKAIESGDILDASGVIRASIRLGATKREAVEQMATLETDLLAVVDNAGRFVSAITQEKLSRELLVGLFRGVNA